jgi:putative transposase
MGRRHAARIPERPSADTRATRKLRQSRPRPSAQWHLDEMVVRIAGKRMYPWRVVDHEREVLDMLVQRRRNTEAHSG